jgi:hypothetical protein
MTLSQNSPKSRLCKRFFVYKFDLDEICYICEEKMYVFADLKKFLVRKSQKDWARKSQNRQVPHLQKVRKSNKFVKSAPQICGFVICVTYLRSA